MTTSEASEAPADPVPAAPEAIKEPPEPAAPAPKLAAVPTPAPGDDPQARADGAYGMIRQVLRQQRCRIVPVLTTKQVGTDGSELQIVGQWGVMPLD